MNVAESTIVQLSQRSLTGRMTGRGCRLVNPWALGSYRLMATRYLHRLWGRIYSGRGETMTDQQHTSHGIELETLEGFAEHAAEHPEEVQLGLRAAATYEGTAAHSLARVDSYDLGGETIARDTREYTIPYGAWREVLDAGGWIGPTDRLEPIEAALSALAACINVGISINAAANGADIDHLQTRVMTDFDPAVLFSLKELNDADSVYENVTAEVEIDGADLDPDQVDEWARRAPVYTLVSLAQDVEMTVKSPATVASDD